MMCFSIKKVLFGCWLILSLPAISFSQTIAEKKAGLGHLGSDLNEEMQQSLSQVNEEIAAYENDLQELYAQAAELYRKNAPEDSYKSLLTKINTIKAKITAIETQWREMATQNQPEGYALWHQPSTTLEQLVIDYGSQDYVYLVPPDIASITLSIDSNLPIPRASWSEMLETILAQNGVGIKQLNPYLRQLYLLQEDNSGLKLLTNNRQDLQVMPGNDHIAFMLSPEPADVRRAWSFLEKFVNPNSVVLQQVGRDILIIGQVAEIQELLKLYDFVSINRGDKDFKIVPLTRVDAEEMAKILGAVFGVMMEEPRSIEVARPLPRSNTSGKPFPTPSSTPTLAPPRQNSSDDNGLKIIPLAQVARAVFLVGTREEIRKAESLIHDVENQVGEARGRVIFWYTTKHSEPEDLAQVLEKIYALLVNEQATSDNLPPTDNGGTPPSPEGFNVDAPLIRRPYDEGYFLDDRFVVNKTPPRENVVINQNRDNFIVDPKTGSIAMVVEADILPKLKELIRKLDVPKKMVQLEVLLFEKRISHDNHLGLDLLRIGSAAANVNKASATFNDLEQSLLNAGVFEFLFSRKRAGTAPAYDFAYRFLISQADVQINASPSVLAVNQTQAIIEIAEEISVNTGIFEVDTIGGVTLKDSFARAQYGIKIDILPTIHTKDDDEFDDSPDYVTLDTDITFQTIQANINDRPDVTTRHIVNEVDLPDGQTVIIGGLRQKMSQDTSESIPFLGELPGLGKLFSITDMVDQSTEMFIFITPKIVYDPVEDLERIRMLEMCRRPGDIPSFLCCLEEARERERNNHIYGSLSLLFGRPRERCIYPQGEYDGR